MAPASSSGSRSANAIRFATLFRHCSASRRECHAQPFSLNRSSISHRIAKPDSLRFAVVIFVPLARIPNEIIARESLDFFGVERATLADDFFVVLAPIVAAPYNATKPKREARHSPNPKLLEKIFATLGHRICSVRPDAVYHDNAPRTVGRKQNARRRLFFAKSRFWLVFGRHFFAQVENRHFTPHHSTQPPQHRVEQQMRL